MKHFLVLSMYFLVFSKVAATEVGCEAYSNHSMRFPVKSAGFKSFQRLKEGLGQLEYESILNKFKKIVNEDVKDVIGRGLKLESHWSEDEVKAYATYDMQDNPVIVISGGFARMPNMDNDSLYLLLCHELGHHLGGAPKKLRGNTRRRSWASAEGQADYYATMKCLPKIFSNLPKRQLRGRAHLIKKCDFPNCERILLASLNVSNIFARLRNDSRSPSLLKKSNVVQSATVYKHPRSQCRLDTFVAGARCERERDSLFDDVDPFIGSCGGESVQNKGSRPRCWFSPSEY